MTIVKINAITVGPDSGDELATRFAARAGAVDGQDGFEGFELLRPTDDRRTWLVVTRWRDEESFQAWLSSQDFRAAHGGRAGRPTDVDDATTASDTGHAEDQGKDGTAASEQARPVGLSAELWGYEVVDL